MVRLPTHAKACESFPVLTTNNNEVVRFERAEDDFSLQQPQEIT